MEEALAEDVAVGVHGGSLFREKISTASDPRAAIRQFAASNALKTPSITPAQEMLDLMDFSRTDQHRLILTQLKSRMLSRIPSLSVEKQLALLNKCFKYISVAELRDLPLAIFSILPKIPSSYLVQFALPENKDLFNELPITVKRQVWSLDAQSGHDLFACHVTSLASQYASQPRVRAACTGLAPPAGNRKAARSSNKPLQELVTAIGDSHVLYHKALATLGAIFEDSPGDQPALCSLRFNLPLAVHEAGAKASQECDLGHRLALAISSGMRHGKDSKDGDRDQCQWMYSVFGVIEGQLQGHPLVISMMLRAPEASCLLLASALDSCKRLAEKEVIPKDDRALQTVTTLMFLQDDDTLHTKQHVNLPDVKRKGGRSTEEDAACEKLLSEFYPTLACALVDDMLREGEGECEELMEDFTGSVATSGVARRLLLQYLCNAAGSGKPGGGGGADCLRVKQLLECYAKAEAGPSCGSDDARYLTVLSKRMASQLKTAQGDAKEALQGVAVSLAREARGAASTSAGLTTALLLLMDAATGAAGAEAELSALADAVSEMDPEEAHACASLCGARAVGDALRRLDAAYPNKVAGLMALFKESVGAGQEGGSSGGGAAGGKGDDREEDAMEAA